MMMADEKSKQSSSKECGSEPLPGRRNPWEIEAIPPGLEETPLDFLFADHHRQRQAVEILLRLADGEYNKTGVRNLIVFLKHDLPLHIADEEHDLLPLLRQQCRPEDDIDTLVERLTGEHEGDESAAREVISLLKGLADGKPLSEEDRGAIRSFAAHLRRHLALENGVLLPIARVRMSAESLKLLSKRMKARRTGGRA